MGTEIERSFRVIDPSIVDGSDGVTIRQGYLSRAAERTVRVRIADRNASLTIKGSSSWGRRAEFEYEIPLDDAESLLGLCEQPIVEKTRHRIVHAGRLWEVDVFSGSNAGLVLAEVEFDSEDEQLVVPAWVGDEVTDDHRFRSSSLSARPFGVWAGDPDVPERPGM